MPMVINLAVPRINLYSWLRSAVQIKLYCSAVEFRLVGLMTG